MAGVSDSGAMPSLADADWLTAPTTQAVMAALSSAGYQVRIVGGAVRNALLGLAVGDIDLATTATPEQSMAAARAAGLGCVPTGLDHGTVTLLADHVPFEVTTLREDVETFRRHAKVQFTADWAADARRRDFTINALYCRADGTIEDPLGGIDDIRARRVRFIGDPAARIHEDDLRILRFFRFHAQYGDGPPDPVALAACEREREGLLRLSAERVRAEIVKLLVARGAADALREMLARGLLTPILRTAPRVGLFARLATLETQLGETSDAMLRLSVLAMSCEEQRGPLSRRLRLSTEERQSLIVVDPALMDLIALSTAQQRALLYRTGAERWRRLMLAGAAAAEDDTRATWLAARSLPDSWPVPVFPLRGADVVALGVPPGPDVGRILAAAEQEWIDTDFALDETNLRARLIDYIARARDGTDQP